MVFWDVGPVNRVSSADFRPLISERIREKVAAQNAGGLPSRPAFPSSPGAVLQWAGDLELCVKSTDLGRGANLRL